MSEDLGVRTTTTYDELVDVPTAVIAGLLHEHGERQLAEMRRQEERPSYRDLFLWRGVLDALAAAAAGERPDDSSLGAPRWLGGLVATRLDEAGRFSHRGGDFTTVRILERRGLVSPPHDDTYALALVGGLGGDPPTVPLRADPELLTTTIWRIFEVEGGGEVSLAAIDKYTSEDVSWASTVRVLTEAGDLDRDRVLDSCLAALDRDFGAFRAGWFSRLWVALVPSQDEVAARQGALRSLLRSDVKPTVALAVKQLRSLVGTGRLDGPAAATAMGPAALSPVKGTALDALRLLSDLHADGSAGVDDIIGAATTALGHSHADVQRAAAALLTRVGGTHAVVEAGDSLAPSVAAEFGVAGAVEHPVPIPVDLEPAAPVVATGGVVTETLAALLEGADDVVGLEMVLAGLSETPDRALLAPLRARATTVLARALRDGEAPASLRAAVAHLVLVGLGDDVTAFPLTYSGYLTNTTLPVAHLVGRLGEVADVVRGVRAPAPLLAAPEHRSGWIHAATLVDRLTRTPDPSRLDLVAALLRLHPDGRTVVGAHGLPAPVRYALGGAAEPVPDGHDAAVWVAAGRTRTVTEVDPLLLRLGLGGAGRAHPLDARVSTTSERHEYDDGRRVQAWTFWRWALELSDPVHQVVASQPTGMGQLGSTDGAAGTDDDEPETLPSSPDVTWSAGFGESNLGAYVDWAATIWPADAEHVLLSTAASVLEAAVSTEVEHDAVRVLDVLGAHPGRLGRLAGVTLAAGLAAGRPEQRVHAVDAVDRLLRAGRLSAEALAEGVTTFGGAGLLPRSATSWKDLASISPQASTFVVDTLTASLPHTDRATNGMHAVLAVLEDELLRAARPTPPNLQPWLRGFAGTSKAARTAGRLAAR